MILFGVFFLPILVGIFLSFEFPYVMVN